ncbi:MAG: TIGR02186 family protein [Nitratireductor sp.]|nr:TIGR02186 family protein [Nitratireductor sp.]MCB1460073.1 TIGR02186 family protein [Nitratireductor sp.]
MMRRNQLSFCLAFLSVFALGEVPAFPQATAREEIQMGISVDTVDVNSDFSGTGIAVFGSIENPDRLAQTLNEYSVVVTVTGPMEEVTVRRKERVFGIWMNRHSRVYRNVPSFYALASNRELTAIAPEPVLKENAIGVDRVPLSLFSTGGVTFTQPAPEFASSLRRVRKEKRLFTEDTSGVVFLGSTLFRANLRLPSNVPIGRHKVTAYLFRNGEMLASREGSFQVEKAGFEKFMYTLAHTYSFWYGVLAVAAALVTGWLASVIFGGGRK